MARKKIVFATLIYWFLDVSFTQNGCSINNICDSSKHDCLTTENVALGKTAEISTSLNSQQYGTSGAACVVVDGKRDNWVNGGGDDANCAHTNESDFTGWWQVHLGRNYTIQNISIYSQDTVGERLSEVRITIDGDVCYDFPSTYTGYPIINIQCNTTVTGSTVRFEKRQRTADVDAYYLVLCEVEIWVCRPGLYGPSCSNRCNCKNNDTCDNYYGTCPNGCVNGYYSTNCSLKCGYCLDVTCHIDNGQCMSGCQNGWTGPYCTESCPDYYYGPNCANKCGHCLRNGTCNTTTGECHQGCDPGWTTVFCNQTCPVGSYGHNCNSTCGSCESTNVPCDPVNGQCPSGCKAGYQPPTCHKTCTNNTYGKNCSLTCGSCASFPCDTVTGRCDQCRGDFSPPLCDVSKEDTSTAIIVGVVVPFIVVLIVVAVVIFILRRRRQPTNKTPNRVTSSELRTSGKGDNKSIGNEGSRFTQKESLDTKSKTDKSKPKVAVKPLVVKTTTRPDIDKSASFYENIGLAASTSLSSDQTEKGQAGDLEADLEIYDDSLQLDDADNLYRNDTVVYGSLKKITSDMDSTQQFLVDRLASGEILIEFKELPKGLPLPHHTALTPINKRKNRFTSVVPCMICIS